MAQCTWQKYQAVFAVAFALLLATGPASAWAVPSDPDNDGLTTIQEEALGTDPLVADTDNDGILDGDEVNIMGTNPLLADTDGNGTIDGLEDNDSDGFSNSAELANGSNPLVANDAGQMQKILLAAPLPTGPDYARVTTAVDTPIAVSWNVGPDTNFASYILEFDASARFDSPVQETYTPEKAVTPTDATWKRITREGRIIYCRVLGVTDNGRRFSSEISSFEITGGPTNIGTTPGTIPTFGWDSAGFSEFRVFLTSREKLNSAVLGIPQDGSWSAFTSNSGAVNWIPGWRTWKAITQLGKDIRWRVVAKDATGRFAYSSWSALELGGGATGGTTTLKGVVAAVQSGNDPDLIPTFSATAGGGVTSYRFLFSGTEDFTGDVITWPSSGWSSTLSYTPNLARWNALTALGPKIYWLVRGFDPTTRFYTTSEMYHYLIGNSFLSVNGLFAGSLNNVLPALPTFDWAPKELHGLAFTPQDYRVIFAGDQLAAGPSVINPGTTYFTATNWTMPSTFAKSVAFLDAAYPFFRVQGRTSNGNSYFSPAYQLVSTEFLRMPILADVGAPVEPSVTYTVSWSRSPDDNNPDTPPTVLYYELQEATSNSFTGDLKSYKVDGTSKNFTHSEVNEVTFFFYRVRAINSVGHSPWSNVDKKKINAVPWVPYYSGSQPTTDGGDNYIIDDQQNNSRGKTVHFGPGWVSRVEGGFGASGYLGDYHYISSTRGPNGTENATFTPNLAKAGTYEVFVGFFATFNRDDHVEFFVNSATGTTGPFAVTMWVPTTAGVEYWVSLGKFHFNAGTSGSVHHQFSYVGRSVSEEFDAAVFKYVGP